MGARKKPLENVGTSDVGIEPSEVGEEGSRVDCGDFHDPEAKPPGQIIEDEDTNDTVEKIVAWLEERKLI
jgi:electron transfer flavoprotein beta subunit